MTETMKRWVPWLLVVASCGYLVLRTAALEGRVAALEGARRVPAVASGGGAAHRGSRRGRPLEAPPPQRSVDPQVPAQQMDFDEPAVRERVEAIVAESQDRVWRQRRDSWREEWSKAVAEELEHFAGDHDLAPETTRQVQVIFDELAQQREILFAEGDEGALSFHEIRREMRGAHELAEQELEDLLGAEYFVELMDRVPMGPGPPRGR